MNPVIKQILLVLVCLFAAGLQAMGQDGGRADSTRSGRGRFLNNIFQQAMNSVRRTPDAGPTESVLNGKSEDPYLPYQGKIIRHIHINPLNFDRNFDDTTARDNSFATRVARQFHKTTRVFVVRDNLFIKENTPLNAFKVADNERYLRTLDFIKDARIIVKPVKGKHDSVDLEVYTKDFFSIAGGAASQGTNHINAQLYETNLAGMGQRLEVTGLYDHNRDPMWAYGALYRKNNLFHTFTDATVAFSTMNNNPWTREEEKYAALSFSKRLVSPYSRTAGAITISHNEGSNRYNVPAEKFFNYRYNMFDAWGGYAIGIKQLTATNNNIRDRRFFAVRYTHRVFDSVPGQVGRAFDPIYNNLRSVLAQFTFYRQDYYKTQYIYGFGTTEDFPYGYNISVTAGWQQQLDVKRPYAGFRATDYIATDRGDFIQLYAKAGSYLNSGKLQDASVLVGATAFSRVLFWNTTKIRQYANVNYSRVYNRLTSPLLRINNGYGPRGFLSDSAYGAQRLSLQLETEFYIKKKLLGFRFAPFPYADLTFIAPEHKPFGTAYTYASVGGGIRARNENLIFETIEIRAYYFPVAPTDMRGFKVVTTSNLRFRYNSTYVTAPDIVQLNGE